MAGIRSFGCLIFLAVLGGSLAFFSSTDNDKLFERYSKMKLLSDCLGSVTLARWRQQLAKASKECDETKDFIPALLHQTPVVTMQQRRPPHYFVPSAVPGQNKQTVFISSSPQNPFSVSPPQTYKTYFYVRQPIAPIVIPQTAGSTHFISPSSPVIQTFAGRTQKTPQSKPPAGQRETYTNPHLKFEDTQQYQDRQVNLRQNTPAVVPTFPHKVPYQNPKPWIPSQRIQRDLSGFYAEPKSEPKPAASNKDHQLRSVLRSRVNEKLEKMTCVMRNMRMLDENLEPNTRFLEESLLELPIPNELFVELKSGMEYCQTGSACKPERPLLDALPVTRQFSSSLEFFRCFGRERLKACLKANVSSMIRLLDRDQVSDPISGFYEQERGTSSAAAELEELLIGATGQLTDLLLL